MPALDNIRSVQEDVVGGWRSKIQSSSLQLSGLVPFVELYALYDNAELEKFETDTTGKYLDLVRRFSTFRVSGDESNIHPDGTLMHAVQLAGIQSQIEGPDRKGGVGITSLDTSRGMKEAFSISYDMSITITNPKLFESRIEYAKFITLNSPFMIIYGWNGGGKFGFPAPPIVSPGRITSVNLSSENSGFWKAALLNLRRYDLSFNRVGQLEGTFSFMVPYTAVIMMERNGRIASDVLSILKNPDNNSVISPNEIKSRAPVEIRNFIPNDVGIKVQVSTTTGPLPADTTQLPGRISANFTLRDLTVSSKNPNIPNDPGPAEIENLKALAQNVLEPIKRQFPGIIITSGFRSRQLNAATPGSSNTSNHSKGMAADIVLSGRTDELYRWISQNIPKLNTRPNELMNENARNARWVHVAWVTNNDTNVSTVAQNTTTESSTQYYYLGYILEAIKYAISATDPQKTVTFIYKDINADLSQIYVDFLKTNRLDSTDVIKTQSIQNAFQIPVKSSFLETMLLSGNMPISELIKNVTSRGGSNLPVEIALNSINGAVEVSVIGSEINGVRVDFSQRPVGSTFDIDFGSDNSLCESVDLAAKLDPNAFETFTLPILVGGRTVDVAARIRAAKLDTDLLVWVRDRGEQFNTVEQVPISIIQEFIGNDPTRYTRVVEALFNEGNVLSNLLGFYLRKTSVKIHGTVGINAYNFIQIRGLISGLSGIYNVVAVTDQLTPSSFSTILEATLLDSSPSS